MIDSCLLLEAQHLAHGRVPQLHVVDEVGRVRRLESEARKLVRATGGDVVNDSRERVVRAGASGAHAGHPVRDGLNKRVVGLGASDGAEETVDVKAAGSLRVGSNTKESVLAARGDVSKTRTGDGDERLRSVAGMRHHTHL
jgi:hypothetical protein